MAGARTVSLSPDGTSLFVSSEYNDQIRLTLRSFSGAIWNRDHRVWVIPIGHKNDLLRKLEQFQFEVDRSVHGSGSEQVVTERLDPTLTVTQLNQKIRTAIFSSFSNGLWVRGELYGFDKTERRDHWFFELIQKSKAGESPTSRLSAVAFASSKRQLLARLARAGDEVRLRDGLEVRFRGRVEFNVARGRLNFIVDDIDTEFSLGELARKRRETLAVLQTEGLLGKNTQLQWPRLPLRVGLITAAESDALHDVLETFRRSHLPFEVVHYPSTVQGPNTEPTVLAGLSYLRKRGQLDCILIVRGGGSRSDLAWFDSLSIARSVATCPIKVVVGVGHERDRSVLDEVAASQKTPTAAAEAVVARVSSEVAALQELAGRFERQVQTRIDHEATTVRMLHERLDRAAAACLERATGRLETQIEPRLNAAVRARLRLANGHLDHLRERLRPGVVLRALRQPRSDVHDCHARLQRRIHRSMQAEGARLDTLLHRLKMVDPAKTLARGFAIVHNHGKLVRSLTDAPTGSVVTVRLHEGKLLAEVVEHHNDSSS